MEHEVEHVEHGGGKQGRHGAHNPSLTQVDLCTIFVFAPRRRHNGLSAPWMLGLEY